MLDLIHLEEQLQTIKELEGILSHSDLFPFDSMAHFLREKHFTNQD